MWLSSGTAASGRILVLRCFLRPDALRDRTLSERYDALRGDPRLESLRAAGGVLPRDIQWIAEGVALAGPDLRQMTAPLVAMERASGSVKEICPSSAAFICSPISPSTCICCLTLAILSCK